MLNVIDSNTSVTTVFEYGTNIRYLPTSITVTLSLDQENTVNDSVARVAILIGIGILILLVLTALVAVALVLFFRKSTQRKLDYDSYSTLCRESILKIQPQSLQASTELYDQIQLSPSTGQPEVISKSEIANTNSPSPRHIDSTADKNKPKSATAKSNTTISNLLPFDVDKSPPPQEQPTYTVVNKQKRAKVSVESQNTAVKNNTQGSLSAYEVEQSNQKEQRQEEKETAIQTSLHAFESPEELYTAVKINSKGTAIKASKEPPPITPYTVEEMYTTSNKKPKAVQQNIMRKNHQYLPIQLTSCMQLSRKSVQQKMKRKLHRYLHT